MDEPEKIDSLEWNAKQMLEHAIKKCDADKPTGAIVIFLWKEKNSYCTSGYVSGMCLSESISLIEYQKTMIIHKMMTANDNT